MCKGSSSSSTIDSRVWDLLSQNVQHAKGVAATPFQAYNPGARVAPLSSNEQAAGIEAGVMPSVGAPAINSAVSTATDLMGFKPSNITAGSLPGIDLSSYMNPFQKGVTDTTMADLERQREMQRVSDNQSATASKAFGGSRAGVAQSLTNEANDRTAASTLAGLNLGNFNNAQSMATNDLNRKLSADTSNQNAGIAGAGINRDAAALGGNLGATQNNLFGDFIDKLMQTGGVERGVAQGGNDAAYEEFLRSIGYQPDMQQLLNSSIGLLGSGNTSSAQAKSNATGGIMSGIGALASTFGPALLAAL